MNRAGILAIVVPTLCVALPLGSESARPTATPSAHAIDNWLGDRQDVGLDPAFAQAVAQQHLQVSAAVPPSITPAAGLGAGMKIVGSVAVMAGDDLTADGLGARRGIQRQNLAEICRRFIAAFGDNYDQIAVFLTFNDA